ncbi:MAG: hypothetical protein JNK89_05915 [Saprospiraceae bacterium]|nr:hypothetical protein [Saprospiraceae bacterium]
MLLFAGMFIELAMQTFWQNKLGMHQSPILWLVSGISVCMAAFALVGFKPTTSADNAIPGSKQRKWVVTASFLLGAIWCGVRLYHVFQRFPIDAKASDIVPSLQMYVQRFLAGEPVYQPLPFEGYQIDPTYFPMMWAPFSFSEILKIDYRWTAYAVFLIPIILYSIRLVKSNTPVFESAIKTLIPFVFLYDIAQNASGTLGLAVELLPVGFYLLLTLTIFHKNRYLMALGILLCLLSRYAFTFWLPLYLLIYWVENGFKNVFKVSLSLLAGVLLLYVLPFLSKDWTSLSKGLHSYSNTATAQWQTQAWQAPGAIPHHLSNGLSFAIYFYEYKPYELADRLLFNKKVHLAACISTAFLLGLGYFFFRKKGLNTRMYLLIGLKFYLLVFYGFFYVPFSYLFQLPLFLSIAILYHIPLTQRQEPAAAVP